MQSEHFTSVSFLVLTRNTFFTKDGRIYMKPLPPKKKHTKYRGAIHIV